MDSLIHVAVSGHGVRLDDVEGRKRMITKQYSILMGCLIGACYAALIVIAFIEKI